MRQGPRIDVGWWLMAILIGVGIWVLILSLT